MNVQSIAVICFVVGVLVGVGLALFVYGVSYDNSTW